MSEEPTMIYGAVGKDGGVDCDDYCYMVVDASKVDKYLKKGWYETPSDLKKPKKQAAKKDVNRD